VEKISHPEIMRDFFMAGVRSVMSVIVHKTPNEFLMCRQPNVCIMSSRAMSVLSKVSHEDVHSF
jgi:hypothetical protein